MSATDDRLAAALEALQAARKESDHKLSCSEQDTCQTCFELEARTIDLRCAVLDEPIPATAVQE